MILRMISSSREHIHFPHIPEIHLHHSRHRSNSFPSLPLPAPPKIRNQFVDMAQRSATARAKLGKLAVPPHSTPSHQKAVRKLSFSFNNLFSTSNESAAAKKRHTYLPIRGNVSSVSSLTLPSPDVSPCLGKLAAVPRSASEELRILKVEHAATLVQNAKLRALLEAEKEYSAMLCLHLQRYHESKGRTNPEKGRIDSVFYRDLKDEDGNSLVSPEVLSPDMRPQNECIDSEWVDNKDEKIKIEIKGGERG